MKPWVKTWRPRQGSEFEVRVSEPSKNFFIGILRLFDEEGHMLLPKSDKLHNAFGLAYGWDSRERRPLEKRFAELIEHGCLTAAQDDRGFWSLTATNFSQWNEDSRPSKSRNGNPPSVRREPPECAPTARPVDAECTPSAIRDVAKPPESLEPKIQDRDREEDRDREHTQGAREDTSVSRFKVFEQTWRSHHGGSGLGLFSAAMARDIDRLRQNITDPAEWRSECAAFAEHVDDPGAIRSVWAVFRGEAGNWKRKLESATSRARGGCEPVTPAALRGPPTDLKRAFAHLETDRLGAA